MENKGLDACFNNNQSLNELTKDILGSYQINVYFAGQDRYSLINTIVNTKVNPIEDFYLDEVKSIKNNRKFNILILSEETVSRNIDLSRFQKIIYYDKFIKNLFNLVAQMYYQNNYDYNYLANAIKRAKKSSTDSVFIGHSYALNGIDETKLRGNVVNLSLSSQDLYYSFSIAKEVMNINQCIKKCYIGTGYWTFYFDLSMTINKNELARIENIYYPIFKDSHNCKNFNVKNIDSENILSLNGYLDQLSRYIFNTERLYYSLNQTIYYTNKSYFNSNIKRELFSLIGNNKLNLLDRETKYRLGKERAEKHNKMIRYVNTRDENVKIMREFLKYLNSKNVQAIIVNFPTTKYYNEYLNKEFKNYYYKIFKELEKEYKFILIDLNNENDLFSDEDYRDLDHMSASGAMKICDIINKKLK